MQYVIGDPAQERRDDFMRELYVRIEKLSRSDERAKNDHLRENIQFQATFIQAAQAATRAVQDEKKAMLRNAVLNSAVGTIDENVRQMFMQLIERLTPLHVVMLKLLDNPSANPKVKNRLDNITMGSLFEIVQIAIPALANEKDFANLLGADLESAKLVNGAGVSVMMTEQGLRSRRSTKLGHSFLTFISDPETGKFPVK